VTQAIYRAARGRESELAVQHAHTRLRPHSLTWRVAAEDGDQVQAGLAGRLCPPVGLAGSTVDAAVWRPGGCSPTRGGCWSWTT